MLVAALLLGPAVFEVAQDSERAAEGGSLPMPSIAFGLVTFAVLMGLLAVTFAFRSVGKRH